MKQAHIFRYVLRLHSKHCFTLQSITFTILFVFSLGHRRLEERQINFAGFCFSYKYYITFFYCKDAVVQEWYRSCFSHTLHFFFDFFHGQITQKYIDQISSPENKKCGPWKVFWCKMPEQEAISTLHCIGLELTFCHFRNFCRKKVYRLDQISLLLSFNQSRGFATQFLQITICKVIENVQKLFCQDGILFSAEIWNVITGRCNVMMKSALTKELV